MKPFMFWSANVSEAGELALALCSRTVQLQNAFGQLICNLLGPSGGSPKSFAQFVKLIQRESWCNEIRTDIVRYWAGSGKLARSIRDHEQHFPIELGNCWVSFEPRPRIEIEYPLIKSSEGVPLIRTAKDGFWDLIKTIDKCLESIVNGDGTWTNLSPRIDLHDPRTQDDGVIQISQVETTPERYVAFVRKSGGLRMHGLNIDESALQLIVKEKDE